MVRVENSVVFAQQKKFSLFQKVSLLTYVFVKSDYSKAVFKINSDF